jgi:hypothetical protein
MKVCHLFAQGRCSRGDCPFRHINVETNIYERPKKREQGARGSKPCRFFAEGTCRYGDDCSFSHDVCQAQSKVCAPKPRKICRFFLAGNCREGDACTFRHEFKPIVGECYRASYLAEQSVDVIGERCHCGNKIRHFMCVKLPYCDHWACDESCDNVEIGFLTNGDEVEVCRYCKDVY